MECSYNIPKILKNYSKKIIKKYFLNPKYR